MIWWKLIFYEVKYSHDYHLLPIGVHTIKHRFPFHAFLLPISCGEGRVVTTDGKGCTDKDECLENPCRNGGFCINQDPRTKYRCVCLDNFWGENCELVQEGRTLKLGMGALAAILVCLLMILSKHKTLSSRTLKLVLRYFQFLLFYFYSVFHFLGLLFLFVRKENAMNMSTCPLPC